MDTNNTYRPEDPPKCPECDSRLEIPDEIIEGKLVECPTCGAESEIIKVNPLTLVPLEEEK